MKVKKLAIADMKEAVVRRWCGLTGCVELTREMNKEADPDGSAYRGEVELMLRSQ